MSLAADRHLAVYFGEDDRRAETADFIATAIAHFSNNDQRERLADAWYELGVVKRALGANTASTEALTKARAIFADLGDASGQAAAVNQLGLLAWRRNQLADATQLFESVAALRAGQDNSYYLAQAFNNLGLVHHEMNDANSAARSFQKALQIWQGNADLLRESAPLVSFADQGQTTWLSQSVTAMTNLGWALESAGSLARAEYVLDRSLSLAMQLDRHSPAARAKNNLARVHYRFGELQLALEYIDQALTFFTSVGRDEIWAANAHESRARIYAAAGEFPLAQQELLAALELRTEERHPLRRAETFLALAELGLDQGDFAQTQTLTDSARALASATDSENLVRAKADELTGRGTLLSGDSVAATASLDQAIQEFDKAGSAVGAAKAGYWKAQSLIQAGAYTAALNELRAVRAVATNIEDVLLLFRVDVATASASFAIDAFDDAQRVASAALERSEQVRGQLHDPLLLRSFAVTQRSAYEVLIDVAIAQGNEGDAWQVANRARSRRLDELLQNRRSPGNDTAADLSVLSLTEVQEGLGEDEILAQYFLGNAQGHAWFVSRNDIKRRRIDSAEDVAQSVVRVTQAVRERRAPAFDDLTFLRTALLPDEQPKMLSVSPDGALHELPFAILPMPAPEPNDARRDATAIRIVPTLRLPTDEFQSAALKSISIAADPVFSRDDQRLRPNDPIDAIDTAPTIMSAALQRSLARFQSDTLARLPGTGQEARSIERLVDKNSAMVVVGVDANKSSVMAAPFLDNDIIHFATHGVVDDVEPRRSGLVLSAFSNAGEPIDRFLSASDIAQLTINSKLVVLSGCETGAGRIVSGEGVHSLSQAFLTAGARQVVSSLWRIPDQATAQLMTAFYEQLLVAGVRPEIALINAQNALRQDRRWREPYFWAGFTIVGR